MTPMEIQYGKTRVVFFRLAKRSAPPFAASVTIDVFGERFAAAYTEGDNREVVATDTMKNFVYATAADFDGRSLESYVMFLGRRLLDTYPQMERIRVTAHEVPLDPAHGGDSDVVFRIDARRCRDVACRLRSIHERGHRQRRAQRDRRLATAEDHRQLIRAVRA